MSAKEITLADLGFENGKRVTTAATTGGNEYNGKTDAGATSSTEERALQLLGSGVSAEATANALGVTPSRISQLLSDQAFSDKVATLRYENLQRHNERDNYYDKLEDKLLQKLEGALPFMIKPNEILRAVNVINGAKRRGQSSPEQTINQQNVVNLVLPAVIAQRFTVNVDNQVTRAGEQELHTMPSSDLLKKIEASEERRQQVLTHMAEPLPDGDNLIQKL